MPGSYLLPNAQNTNWRDGAGSRVFLTLKSHHSHTAHAAQHPFPSVATLSRAGGAARPGNYSPRPPRVLFSRLAVAADATTPASCRGLLIRFRNGADGPRGYSPFNLWPGRAGQQSAEAV